MGQRRSHALYGEAEVTHLAHIIGLRFGERTVGPHPEDLMVGDTVSRAVSGVAHGSARRSLRFAGPSAMTIAYHERTAVRTASHNRCASVGEALCRRMSQLFSERDLGVRQARLGHLVDSPWSSQRANINLPQ